MGISSYSAAPNICNDWARMRSCPLICVTLTRTMCQEFFFFLKDTPIKRLTGSFLCGDFPVLLWHFWLEFSVFKRCHLTALCNWKPLFIDRSCTLKAGEISLCRPGERHPCSLKGPASRRSNGKSMSVSPILC